MTNYIHQTADFKSLVGNFSGDIILPDNDEYEALRVTFAVTDAKPAIIVRPLTSDDIAAALHFVAASSLQLSVRSGKHSVAGFSTNNDGLVLDMSNFNTVKILDEEKGIVRLGTGALWGDVAVKLGKHSLAVSSGDTKTVGVGGLTLGGGIGWMVRKYGYAVDSLVGADIVLADGSVVRASETENSDLFWAMRGGGGNFGVVTSFDFQAHREGQVVSSTITYEPADLKKIITGWRDHLRTAPKDLTSFLTLLPSFGAFPASVMIMSCYAGSDEAEANAVIEPLRQLGTPTSDITALIPYAEILHEARPPQGVRFTTKSMFIKTLGDELIAALDEVCCKPGSPIVQVRMMNGAVDIVDSSATAMAHRGKEAFLFAGFGVPIDANEEQTAKILQNWRKLAPFSSGIYSNFLSTNTESDVSGIYPPDTYERLAKVKLQYDPDNIFSHNFNIIPAKA
jgi:FAD/FMN-containing dehydrogenase